VHRPFHCVAAGSLSVFFFAIVSGAGSCRADQVETVTGDRYTGRVVSLGNDTLVLQNEILGTLKLPRSQVAAINLNASSALPSTNLSRAVPNASVRSGSRSNLAARATSPSVTNQFDAAIRQLGTNSSVISQVQDQLLTGAGPEAQGKFNELLSGLLSGKMGVNELRTQARTTLDQARAAQKELGDEGVSLEGYLSILERFLKETTPAGEPVTNAVVGAISQKITPQKPSEEE